MPVPVRYLSGFTQAAVWQSLGNAGIPDPAFYVQDFDDFLFFSSAVTERWTSTLQNSGTAAANSLDGGNILLTTGIAATNTDQLQRPTAMHQSDPATNGRKRTIFKIKFQLADVTNSVFAAGLAVVTAPVVVGTTEGIYLSKADTSADLTLKVRNASATVTSSAIATLVNDTIYEAAFEVLPGGDVVGGLAVSGYRPGGGTGSTTDPRFPRVRLTAPLLSILLQSPFVSLASGAAAGAKTGKVDFIGAFRER